MTTQPLLPWHSVCPGCKSDSGVYIYDRGAKFLRRLVVFDNRFACSNCTITWRRKTPNHTLRLKKEKPPQYNSRLYVKDNGPA
jgi:hypothetical protein